MIELCYASGARMYRQAMAGSSDATELPRPSGSTGSEQWQTVVNELKAVGGGIDTAMKEARDAHQGQAAEAAQISVDQVAKRVKTCEDTAKSVQKAITDQANAQGETFKHLPAQGEKLPNGEMAQLDPPDKNWAERHGVDSFPGLGWTSDYEEKQRRFQATNSHADQVMQQYQQQTQSRIQSLPKFEPPPQEPPPQPPPGDSGDSTTARGLGQSSYSSTPNLGSGGGGGTPSSTQSAWAPSSGSVAPSPSPSPSSVPAGSGTQAPAGTSSTWAGGNSNLPPGTVRGQDGMLYRQMPDGSWQRQNPYNGRWAPAPGGPGGTARGGPGGAGRGGAGGARGGGSGRADGGFGPRSGAGATPGSGSGLSAGGRSGVAPTGGPGSGASSTASGGATGGQSGRGGGMRPMGGGGQQGQGGEEEEHERPSWLVEDEDVFTNDMQKSAPPVIGIAPWEKQG
ncbi:hypothetical protein FHX42_004957 [Saccharopolyspora lacisalsi]|uniref:PPE family protein n=1 Tax=Halosaccharopolyspora lacisalsi TaxID=1000566 RepID=A0A839E8G0_9PSEU|nr:hypothetical protein [Halosaccharopolyspora lacisalsi]MBA8827561.1 hypothetical protein [Halosaccharopolyspora lacisalsi]